MPCLKSIRSSTVKAALIAVPALLLPGCIDEYQRYETRPVYYYEPPPPIITQRFVYNCKRTWLGGDYCRAKPVGQPYGYGYFYPY